MEVNEDKLDKADKILTKFGIILKKHWGKLILILLCWCIYWACTQDPFEEEYDNSYIEEVYPDTLTYDDSL